MKSPSQIFTIYRSETDSQSLGLAFQKKPDIAPVLADLIITTSELNGQSNSCAIVTSQLNDVKNSTWRATCPEVGKTIHPSSNFPINYPLNIIQLARFKIRPQVRGRKGGGNKKGAKFFLFTLTVLYIGKFSHLVTLVKMTHGRCVNHSPSSISTIWRVVNEDLCSVLFSMCAFFAIWKILQTQRKLDPSEKFPIYCTQKYAILWII